jgi:chemotaxis protein CheX
VTKIFSVGEKNMDVKSLNPFLVAAGNILGQFGVSGTKVLNIIKKDKMYVETDITVIIGLTGDLKGTISYSMSEDTAKKIVSCMMMGMPVTTLDEIGLSALGELSNMIMGTASTMLSENNYKIDITPPSTVCGKDIQFRNDTKNIICVKLGTDAGELEVNMGLE